MNDYARTVRDARRRGWIVRQTGGGHLRLEHPNGGVVFGSVTPSDSRAHRQLDRDLRRVERAAARVDVRCPACGAQVEYSPRGWCECECGWEGPAR